MQPKYYGIMYEYHVTDRSCDQFINWIDQPLFILCLPSNGQAQTWKALYINVMFSNDIKLRNFILAALTVLRSMAWGTNDKWESRACDRQNIGKVDHCLICMLQSPFYQHYDNLFDWWMDWKNFFCNVQHFFYFSEAQFQHMNIFRPAYSIFWMWNGSPMISPLLRKSTFQLFT